MKETKLYRILRPLIVFFVKVLIRPKFIGLENISKDGRLVLAGNHTSIMDPLLLITATKRNIHFLAKDELWHGVKKIIFANLGLIPVNRRVKDPNAMNLAIKCLDNEQVIGIFPEGTTEKGRGLLPFKIGAVKMAHDTNTKIVPFIIKGKYRLFSRNLSIKFLKPMIIKNDDLIKENDKLRMTIKNIMEE